jgi:antitoxin VapB
MVQKWICANSVVLALICTAIRGVLLGMYVSGVSMGHIAKVFLTGRSQAVRLPAAFRFDTKEVYVRRDETTGDVILSRRPNDWHQLLVAIANARPESQDVLADRIDPPAQSRDPY